MMATLGMLRVAVARLSRSVPTATWAVAVAVLNIALAVSVSGVQRGSAIVGLVLLCAAGLIYLLRHERVASGIRRSGRVGSRKLSRTDPRVQECVAADRWDRSLSDGSFTEDLDLTIWVGATADEDRIVESRFTRHTDPIRFRSLTLVSPYVGSDTEKVSVTPVLTVAKRAVEPLWVPLENAGRGVAVFSPPSPGEVLEWQLSYEIPGGLWNPLRSLGLDVFRYDVRRFPIGRFSVRFIIPSAAKAVFVQERNRRGAVREVEQGSDGSWEIAWVADSPTVAAKFEWDIRVDWAGESD
jgi:hypothetical protein